MSVNYQNNGTDLGTTYAKYASTHNGSIAGAITSPTKTATNFKYNGTDLADIFVKYSDLEPNNMKGTTGSACGFTSNAYRGDLGTNLVVKDTIEYLLRVQLTTTPDTYQTTYPTISQAWTIEAGSTVFNHVNLVFTAPAGKETIFNITTSPISISVSKNTHYTYYLTPYTNGNVATSNSKTADFWTPPSVPTISGSTSALATANGSEVYFTFNGTFDDVLLFLSGSAEPYEGYGNVYIPGSNSFSLPTTKVVTTSFVIVPFDHRINNYNVEYASSTFTFTVSDGTASLGTTTDITSSGFTINITGTGIASVTGTKDGGTTNVTGTVSGGTSATVAFSSLSAYTDYSVSVTVTFLSGNTKTLSTTVKTQSNIVVGTPSATSTYYSITVTISATNTTQVTDTDLNKYTQTPNTNDWSYTYGDTNSKLTADEEYKYKLTIAGYTGNAPEISYYTRPYLSITKNSISRTSASVGNVNLTVSGTFTKYKIFWNTDNNFDTQNNVVTDLTTKYSQDYTITIPSTVSSSSSMVYNLFVVSWNNNSKEYFTKSDYYYSQFDDTIPAYSTPDATIDSVDISGSTITVHYTLTDNADRIYMFIMDSRINAVSTSRIITNTNPYSWDTGLLPGSYVINYAGMVYNNSIMGAFHYYDIMTEVICNFSSMVWDGYNFYLTFEVANIDGIIISINSSNGNGRGSYYWISSIIPVDSPPIKLGVVNRKAFLSFIMRRPGIGFRDYPDSNYMSYLPIKYYLDAVTTTYLSTLYPNYQTGTTIPFYNGQDFGKNTTGPTPPGNPVIPTTFWNSPYSALETYGSYTITVP
jgi:hypothetical protein